MASLGDKLQDLKNTITGEDKPARWEDEAPHYRYGWEKANDRQHHNRTWTEAEPELRREWEGRKARPGWEQASGRARDAWNKTIQLREEQLRAVKDTHEAGAVTV